jgi:large subunit ribosomal protein L24
MKAKLRIKRNDTVIVITGKDKGRVGKVVRVLPAEGRVQVEGVALQKRHVKGQGDQPGSVVMKERAIHISNVALYDADSKTRIKVGYTTDDEGNKRRVNRKTGAVLAETGASK